MFIGALTLEAHQSVMGDQAKDIVWHHDASVLWFFYYGNGTKDRSIGIIDLPCVIGGSEHADQDACCSRERFPCLLSKSWLKENGAVLNTSSEELLLTKRQITHPYVWKDQVDILSLICVRERRILARGRTGNPEAIVCAESGTKIRGFRPNTPSRAPGDLLESHDPEMLSLPAEQYPVIDEPRDSPPKASSENSYCRRLSTFLR